MKSQTRLSVRSINQSNRSISVRLSFLFCSRAFISRSYENRSSNVCKAAPIFSFWAPNGLNALLEMRSEFLFILIGKKNNGFFNRPIMECTQILVHGWGAEQGFWCCFKDGLNQGFGFVCLSQITCLYY